MPYRDIRGPAARVKYTTTAGEEPGFLYPGELAVDVSGGVLYVGTTGGSMSRAACPSFMSHAERVVTVLAEGQVVFDSKNMATYVGDGLTPGGLPSGGYTQLAQDGTMGHSGLSPHGLPLMGAASEAWLNGTAARFAVDKDGQAVELSNPDAAVFAVNPEAATIQVTQQAHAAGTLTYNWGDGTADTVETASGFKTITHTYATPGWHLVTITPDSAALSAGSHVQSPSDAHATGVYQWGRVMIPSYTATNFFPPDTGVYPLGSGDNQYALWAPYSSLDNYPQEVDALYVQLVGVHVLTGTVLPGRVVNLQNAFLLTNMRGVQSAGGSITINNAPYLTAAGLPLSGFNVPVSSNCLAETPNLFGNPSDLGITFTPIPSNGQASEAFDRCGLEIPLGSLGEENAASLGYFWNGCPTLGDRAFTLDGIQAQCFIGPHPGWSGSLTVNSTLNFAGAAVRCLSFPGDDDVDLTVNFTASTIAAPPPPCSETTLKAPTVTWQGGLTAPTAVVAFLNTWREPDGDLPGRLGLEFVKSGLVKDSFYAQCEWKEVTLNQWLRITTEPEELDFDMTWVKWNDLGFRGLGEFLTGNAYFTTPHYDALLIHWKALREAGKIAPGAIFTYISAGQSKYTPGGEAEAARTWLTTTGGFSEVRDGGPA